MKRILCLWLPLWPIQRLVAARPELKGRAIILYAHKGSRGQRVTVCSREASALGVCHDMPLAEATSLARKSSRLSSEKQRLAAPTFHTESYDPAADRRELAQLAEWCERFSPIVGIEKTGDSARGEPEEPESLLLDVTGLGPLFGGEESLLRKMVTEFAQRGYVARGAIADAIGTAWAVVRSVPDVANPNGSAGSSFHEGIQIVPSGDAAAAIAPLPLAALRLPNDVITVLQQLGIRQAGQLFNLPRASLSSRFGDIVLLRIDQALGRVREMITAHRAQPTFQANWILEHPTERRDVVEFVIQQLIARVAHLLADQNRGVVRMEIRLRCELDDPPPENSRELDFRVGLFRPTATARHLWELAQLQLEQATWPGAVARVIVQASLTAPLEIRQGQLFEDAVRDGQRQLALLIERLSSRLGTECVLQPRVVADAQPDRACRYIPLAGRPPRGKSSAENRAPQFRAADRPLHLEHPPLPLQVVIAVSHGPPARFRDQNRWHTVVRYWGPERIETGWWRGRSVRRDYYRVETETGLWFWLFRRLDDGSWFLQGRFE